MNAMAPLHAIQLYHTARKLAATYRRYQVNLVRLVDRGAALLGRLRLVELSEERRVAVQDAEERLHRVARLRGDLARGRFRVRAVRPFHLIVIAAAQCGYGRAHG